MLALQSVPIAFLPPSIDLLYHLIHANHELALTLAMT